jgi:hypothetical protein
MENMELYFIGLLIGVWVIAFKTTEKGDEKIIECLKNNHSELMKMMSSIQIELEKGKDYSIYLENINIKLSDISEKLDERDTTETISAIRDKIDMINRRIR